MDFSKTIAIALSLLKLFPVIGKASQFLNPTVISTVFGMATTATGFVEGIHNGSSGEQKKAEALDFLEKGLDLLAETHSLTPDQVSFLKTQFVPVVIDLVVGVINTFGFFGTAKVATVVDPNKQ